MRMEQSFVVICVAIICFLHDTNAFHTNVLPVRTERILQASKEPDQTPFVQKPTLSKPGIARLEYTDAGTLQIDIPPMGLTQNAVFSGAFAAAWFSTIVPATASGGLFLVPFWLAGGLVAKTAVYDPFISTRLILGKYAWSLDQRYAGRNIRHVEGASEDLGSAQVECSVVENGKPKYIIQLFAGSVIEFGLGLPLQELEFLTYTINAHLDKLRS